MASPGASVTGVAQLQARLHAISPATGGQKLMERLGLAVVGEAKRLVHRKTGNLGRSIHISAVGPTRVTVTASARYAAYVEFGTRGGQVIVPVRRKALRWAATAGGARLSGTPRRGAAVIFARRVIRGATRPYPYMIPGAQAAVGKSGLRDQIVMQWNSAA